MHLNRLHDLQRTFAAFLCSVSCCSSSRRRLPAHQALHGEHNITYQAAAMCNRLNMGLCLNTLIYALVCVSVTSMLNINSRLDLLLNINSRLDLQLHSHCTDSCTLWHPISMLMDTLTRKVDLRTLRGHPLHDIPPRTLRGLHAQSRICALCRGQLSGLAAYRHKSGVCQAVSQDPAAQHPVRLATNKRWSKSHLQ